MVPLDYRLGSLLFCSLTAREDLLQTAQRHRQHCSGTAPTDDTHLLSRPESQEVALHPPLRHRTCFLANQSQHRSQASRALFPLHSQMAAATGTVGVVARRTGLRIRPEGGSGTEAGPLSGSGRRRGVWRRRGIEGALGEVFLGTRTSEAGAIWEHGARILENKGEDRTFSDKGR